MLLLAQGWTDARIRGALGIDQKTLRKYYFRELATRDAARDQVEAIGLLTLWEQGLSGNTAAMKEFFRRHDQARAAPFEQKERETEKLGKKDQLRREAGEPPSDWSDVTPRMQ